MNRHLTVEPIIQTVDTFPDARKGEGGVGQLAALFTMRGEILPPWGTRARLRKLREYYFHPRSFMLQGVFNGLCKKWGSAPWEVTGPGNVARWQTVLAEADYGHGWGDFVQVAGTNYLRYDVGAWVQVIGPGPCDWPILGAVTGIANLDPMRCYPTGDPLYPLVYYTRDNEETLFHHSRVFQLVDMPDGSQSFPSWGLCAESRAIAIAYRQILMDRYTSASLDDRPKPGIMTVTGMTEMQWHEVKAKYLEMLRSDDPDVFGQTMTLFALAPDVGLEVNVTDFSAPPEKFDYSQYVEVDAKTMALAVGVDPQDIYPLSSGNLGTGTQTEILSAMARGKTFADFVARLTRALNFYVLPNEYEFEIKFQDDQSDQVRAQIAATNAQTVQTVVNAANIAGEALPSEAIVRYLVQVDPVWADVFTNPDGTIRSLTDRDPKRTEAIADDTTEQEDVEGAPDGEEVSPQVPEEISDDAPEAVIVDDITAAEPIEELQQQPLAGAQMQQVRGILAEVTQGIIAPGAAIKLLISLGYDLARARRIVEAQIENAPETPAPMVEAEQKCAHETMLTNLRAIAYCPSWLGESAIKEWQQTRSEFIQSFTRVLSRPARGVRAFATMRRQMRQVLRRLGEMAYTDGLVEGGIAADEITPEDREAVLTWVREQEQFIDRTSNEIFRQEQLPTAQAEMRAELWANKSLRSIYQAGRASADRNGMYKWRLGATEQHCTTCMGLNGQVHRMDTWTKAGLLPGVDKLECKGYNCDCELERTNERARGSLTAYKNAVCECEMH